MRIAEFEEKEFEAPLYNQLEQGTDLVWSPGQVFEGHIGIDRALFSQSPLFWKLAGRLGPARGAFLHRYDWDFIWRRRRSRRRLPNFRLNLFLQAKRPWYYQRTPRNLSGRSLRAPLWRIDFVSHQQAALERVARSLGDRALVCYAAPAFHRLSQLYAHTRQGSIIENSSFPEAASMSGHTAWWYNQPGAVGLANPEFKSFEGPGLLTRLKQFSSKQDGRADQGAVEHLGFLANEIERGMGEPHAEEDARRAEYFSQIKALSRDAEEYEMIGDPLYQFLRVLVFVSTYNLEWYAVE